MKRASVVVVVVVGLGCCVLLLCVLGGYLDFYIYIFWRVCVCVKCKIRLFSLSFFLFSPSSEGWVYGECFMFVWFGYNSCTHA